MVGAAEAGHPAPRSAAYGAQDEAHQILFREMFHVENNISREVFPTYFYRQVVVRVGDFTGFVQDSEPFSTCQFLQDGFLNRKHV